jgi:hypothetical protein
MMWHLVIPAWVALLEADTALVAALGGAGRIYPAQAATAVRIPSVEYLMVSDMEQELFNPILLQVDYWVKGINRAATIERHIRRLTHRDTARELGGMRLWTQYIDSRTLEYRAEVGVTHRSMDFRFTPLRAKYHRTTAPVE